MNDPHFSEIKYLGGANLDFIEVSVPSGTDVSDLFVTVYRADGSIRTTSVLSVLTPVNVSGRDVYVIENGDATNFNGVALSEAVALTQNGTVFQFLSFDDTAGTVTATEGPAAGLTSTDVGIAGAGESLETADGGQTYFTQTEPNAGFVTCFTTSTRIETERGPMPVEDVTEGVPVLTSDGTCKPVRKILRRTLCRHELRDHPKLCPVRIRAGALGAGLPVRDLLVSRQHRMLVASPIVERMFETSAVLVAAVKLTHLPGISLEPPERAIEYIHLIFDAHEVIYAEGAPSESFFLGAEALKTLPAESLREVIAIFPDLDLPLPGTATRFVVPPGRRQARLVERHHKNRHPLLGQSYCPPPLAPPQSGDWSAKMR
jgi:hypothetical protein